MIQAISMGMEDMKEILEALPEELVWRMAEGMPKQDIDQKTESEIKHIIQIDE